MFGKVVEVNKNLQKNVILRIAKTCSDVIRYNYRVGNYNLTNNPISDIPIREDDINYDNIILNSKRNEFYFLFNPKCLIACETIKNFLKAEIILEKNNDNFDDSDVIIFKKTGRLICFKTSIPICFSKSNFDIFYNKEYYKIEQIIIPDFIKYI